MGGLSLYLNAVQIIRLNTSGERSASDYGFGAKGVHVRRHGDDVAPLTPPQRPMPTFRSSSGAGPRVRPERGQEAHGLPQ
ncbi:MAG: hypothetical protein ACLSAH_17570 [Bilophila wadsworthia]